MRLARTAVSLICLSVVVHTIDAHGWAHLSAAPVSGGAPSDCTGGFTSPNCKDAVGSMCKVPYDNYDGTVVTKTRIQDVTATACVNMMSKGCLPTDYSQSKTGCIQK